MPPWPISWPDRIKNGIANSAKLSIPVAILCATATNVGNPPMVIIARTVDIPMQNATGTFNKIRIAKLATKTNIGRSKILSFQILMYQPFEYPDGRIEQEEQAAY